MGDIGFAGKAGRRFITTPEDEAVLVLSLSLPTYPFRHWSGDRAAAVGAIKKPQQFC